MPKQTVAASQGRNGKGYSRAPSPAATAEAKGAATLTDGLDLLDRERASSLADEGGMAGAFVEAQPPATVTRSRREARRRSNHVGTARPRRARA